jgi:hypothetical protein
MGGLFERYGEVDARRAEQDHLLSFAAAAAHIRRNRWVLSSIGLATSSTTIYTLVNRPIPLYASRVRANDFGRQ